MIELKGEERLGGKPEEIWLLLNDPSVLKMVVPGCEEIEELSPTEFKARINLKIGALNIKLRGRISLANLNPPFSYSLIGEGDGGISGFVRGEAQVELTPISSEKVLLSYNVKALPGGKLASLGTRMLKGVAEKLAQDFFAAFVRHCEQMKPSFLGEL